jgi:hypothetical protein
MSMTPLASRRIRNQGADSKACLDLSRIRNAECGFAWKPLRARPEARICYVLLLAKGWPEPAPRAKRVHWVFAAKHALQLHASGLAETP